LREEGGESRPWPDRDGVGRGLETGPSQVDASIPGRVPVRVNRSGHCAQACERADRKIIEEEKPK